MSSIDTPLLWLPTLGAAAGYLVAALNSPISAGGRGWGTIKSAISGLLGIAILRIVLDSIGILTAVSAGTFMIFATPAVFAIAYSFCFTLYRGQSVRFREAIKASENLTHAYAAVLEKCADSPNQAVYDLSVLPASKNEIKKALLVSMKLSENAEHLEALKGCYLSLADFQAGVGPKTNAIMTDDLRSCANDLDDWAKNNMARMESMANWRRAALKEMLSLQKELARAGFSIPKTVRSRSAAV